ncbi:sel1 repeat family protein [Myxococcota bacterium]|nr:sel1 repeat family protein [Myxococcota bacterium]MBU1381856.1 sel1 repeat family protein [Myxococcota bacterium]MBU1495591.1 sel1 repeat family protein [Myxococcota bacterium]
MKIILASLIALFSLTNCVQPTETTPTNNTESSMEKPEYSTCRSGYQPSFYHRNDIEISASDKSLVSIHYHKGQEEWKDGDAAVNWFINMTKSPGMAFYYSGVCRNHLRNTASALNWIDFAICHAPYSKNLWLEKLDIEINVIKNRGIEKSSQHNAIIVFGSLGGLREKYKKLLQIDNAKLDFLFSKFGNDYEILLKMRELAILLGSRARFNQINRFLDKIKTPDNSDKITRAEFLFDKKLKDEALKLVKEVLSSDPMNSDALILMSNNTEDKKQSDEYKKLAYFYRMMPKNWKTKWTEEKWNIWTDLGDIKKVDESLVKLRKLPVKVQASLLSSSARSCHACQYGTPQADHCFKLIRELFNLGTSVHRVFEDMIIDGIHCHGTRKAVSQAMLARSLPPRNENIIPLLLKYEYDGINMEKIAFHETLLYYGHTSHIHKMIKNAVDKDNVFETQTMEAIRALAAYFGEYGVSALNYIKKEKKDNKALQIHIDLCLWGMTENKDYLNSVEKAIMGLTKTNLSVSHMCPVNTEHADFKAMVENLQKQKKVELKQFIEYFISLPKILNKINLITHPMVKKQGIAEDKYKVCMGGNKKACQEVHQAFKILIVGIEFDKNHPAGPKYVKLVEFLCGLKDSDACNDAGIHYGTGNFVKKDSEKSLSFYKKSCSLKNGLGCSNYGWMFLNGEGTEKDYKTGVSLCEKACKMGDPMGCIYASQKWGDYNPDSTQSGIYLKKACSLGLGKACFNYAITIDENPNISDDRKKTLIGLAIAEGCSKGHNKSCNALFKYLTLPPKPTGK